MSYTNISAELPQEQLDEAILKLGEVGVIIEPFAINLTPDEIRKLAKMGDKSIPFVDKSLELAIGNPQYVPGFLNVPGWQKDVVLAKQLKTLLNVLEPLWEKVRDTYIAVGSEAFNSARIFYNSVQKAAEGNVPGSNALADEMGKRYNPRPRKEAAQEVKAEVKVESK